jgi:hypothetical protein
VTWLSFDDGYTRQPVWENISYDTRWHFHALIEFCGATRRYSGRVRLADALRCSDVPDPQRCLTELFQSGLVVNLGAEVEVADVDNYLPPEAQRDESLLPRKRANQAAYRRRRCESGRHDKNCPPSSCPVKLARAQERDQRVTGNAGTGRVGSGSTKTEGLVEDRTSSGYSRRAGAGGDGAGGFGGMAKPPEDASHGQPEAPSPKTGDGSNTVVHDDQQIPDEVLAGASHQTVTRARGGRPPLPEPTKQMILSLSAQGVLNQAQIARQAGVARSTVHKVLHQVAS